MCYLVLETGWKNIPVSLSDIIIVFVIIGMALKKLNNIT